MKLATRLGLAACVALGAITPATANHSWGGYHWARTTTGKLSVKVNVAVDPVWTSYVNTAIRDWDVPVVSGAADVLTLTSGTVTVDRRKCNPIAGQILVCNYAYGKRGWLGIASIWADGSGHITQATTKLNDSYTSSWAVNGYRALVSCQEIGHDFGLAHQDEAFSNTNLGTCMDYTNAPAGSAAQGASNEKPNAHDYQQLATIYNHADSSTTATSGAAATNFGERSVGKPAPQTHSEGSGDTAAEWGTVRHRDEQGRPDQFIRRYSDGTVMLTHVLWAPGTKGTEAN